MPIGKEVRSQLQGILDTHGDVEQLEVIIQMEPSQRETLSKATSETISRRHLSQSARDVLPRTCQNIGTTQYSSMRKNGRLHSLVDHPIVQKVIAEQRAAKSENEKDEAPPSQWGIANAMPIQISRDDLSQLVNEVEGIKSVHVNRQMRMPSISQVEPLIEEKVNTLGATWGLLKTNALAAWGRYGAKGKDVKVGLLDTGVDAHHPDLTGKICEFAEFDSLGQLTNTQARDSHWHGTHCAGTIVGGNTSQRAIGMAPEAKLAVALVLNGKAGGTDAQILAGIDWVLNQKVDVISMSLGGLTIDAETPPTYTEAILSCWEQGVPVVVAMGNEGHQTTSSPGNDLFALSIGATDNIDRAAGFSGGRTQIIRSSDYFDQDDLPLTYTKPELSAPGVAVVSCIPGSKWKASNGTSMATPHVAGAIAQLLSATRIRGLVSGFERVSVIQDLIIGSAEDCGESGQDQRFGFGRLNILRAIDYALERGYR